MTVSVLYQNVPGLKSKLTNIYKNSLDCEHQIICLTETWLNDNISSSEFHCDSFNIHRHDREETASTKQHGGSVLVAVDKSLSSIVRQE